MKNFFESQLGDYTLYCFKTGVLRENSFVLKKSSSEKVVIIDPGGDGEDICRFLGELKLTPVYILATHGHHDHISAAELLVQQFGIKFFVSEADLFLIKKFQLYSLAIEKKAVNPIRNFEFYSGSKVPFLDEEFEVLSSPGHTPGSVTLRLGDFYFTGDTILKNHPEVAKLPGSDKSSWQSSVENLIALLNDKSVVFPGHGSPWGKTEIVNWWSQQKQEAKH